MIDCCPMSDEKIIEHCRKMLETPGHLGHGPASLVVRLWDENAKLKADLRAAAALANYGRNPSP